MKIFRTSLRNKVVGVFLLPTIVIVLIYGLLAYFAAREGLEDELGKRLVSVGQTISAEMSNGFEAKQIARLDATKKRVLERLRDRLEAVRSATNVRRIFMFDEERRSIVDTRPGVEYGQQLYGAAADRLEIRRTFEQGEATTSVLFEDEQGTPYKTGYVPIELDGEVIAALGVEGSTQYFELLRDFGTALSVIGAIGLVLVIVAGTLFARALVRPVNRLVDAARRLGEGDLETEIVDEAGIADEGDEIDFLAESFEEMRRNILSRDRQMQMMLSGIAHEVRNPLGGMELFCGLLREDLVDEGAEANADKIEKIDKIKRELGYLEKVVKDFLDFARDVPIERERFAAGVFADEICGLLDGEVSDAECLIETDVEDDVDLTADREKLRRVVINLVRNAYQACDGGCTIRLEVDAPDDRTRRIVIVDDGPGIPEDKLEEIMTPFFTTREKGSGLGLALARQIVEQHGGELVIASTEGDGTRVTVTLPFDEDIEAPQQDIPEGWLG
ncbi:MAG: ATP-binding protein [Myxococcota bacterium]